MALSASEKEHYLEKAIEIAKESAASGANVGGTSLAGMMQVVYDKMIEIAEGISE